jgi:hypothetical protein
MKIIREERRAVTVSEVTGMEGKTVTGRIE